MNTPAAGAEEIRAFDTSHDTPAPGDLGPGVYLSNPQGHALLVGDNGRALAVLDMGVVSIGGVEAMGPNLVEQFADRLYWLAKRMRGRLVEPVKGAE